MRIHGDPDVLAQDDVPHTETWVREEPQQHEDVVHVGGCEHDGANADEQKAVAHSGQEDTLKVIVTFVGESVNQQDREREVGVKSGSGPLSVNRLAVPGR
jgi:hypothetical protein